MNLLWIIIFCSLYAAFNVSGSALIKTELPFHSLNGVMSYLKFLISLRVILGFGLIAISALVMFKALSIGKFSYVVPISAGINFCFTVIIGITVFKDNISWFSFMGLVLILTGIVLMSLKTT